ncbi:MAG: AMIN domain-containing protein [Gemmatimonadaceae bacterium]|jgi:type IV pilus assembly protein PilQ|nr:AMIN domain-containing protein [Gemmatimonadaceae bacterium]
MIVQTTAAVLTVALVHAAALDAATRPVPGTASPAASAAMYSAFGARAATNVTGVSLVPGADGAEVVVGLDAASATVRDFTLANPSRVVLDVIGARLAVKPRAYDRTARGAVRDVRVAQFAVDTVRVVVELAGRQRYTVKQSAGEVRLVVHGTAQFARWDMIPGGFAPTVTLAQVQPAASTESTPAADVSAPTISTAASLPAPTATLASQTAGLNNVPLEALKPVEPVLAPINTPSVTATPVATTPALVETPVTRDERAGRLETNSSFSSNDTPARIELPVAIPAAPQRAQAQLQPSTQPRISINFDGTDIRDVIATFATFANRSIVVGKNVQGTVTAEITDKPWDVALQALLQAQGLAATEDPSGIITVDSYSALAQNQALEPLVTQIVNVNYAKAVSLVPTVRALLARDCSNITTMQTMQNVGGGAGMGAMGGMGGMGAQGGGRGQGNQLDNQGCVMRGSVSADSATNKLIISEVPTRLPELIKRLQELDVRTPQVAIKAKIIFINRTGIQDIGLAYDLGTGTKQFFQQLVPRTDPNTLVPIDTDGDGVPDARGGGTPFQGPARIALGGNAISGIANANNAIKPNALNLIYSTALGRYQLTAFLNALQTSSLADVQSEPSVTILNNRTAEIFVGQEIPIRVIDASAGGVGGGAGGGGGGGGAGAGGQVQPNAQTFFPRASVQIKEAGIRLSVTPQVTNNRMVMLSIKAENSNAEVGPSDVGIIFNQQRAESQVLVADGEAAVIGGLTVTEVSRFRSGIPFLMNIPFAGRLFSQNTTNETKRDLLILVTPHILEGGETLPPSR